MAPRKKQKVATTDGYDVRRMDSNAIARVVEFYSSRILHTICTFGDGGKSLSALAIAHLVHNRRKIIATNRDEAMTLLFHSFAHPQCRLAAIKGMRVEHTLTLRVVDEETKRASKTKVSLSAADRHLSILMDDFMRFRGDVVERYRPLINKRASAYLWAKTMQGIRVESDDANQNFVMAATRALDKFHPTAGSLTTYVGHWLRDAGNSQFAAPLSEAFTLSRNARRKIHDGGPGSTLNNKSVQLEDMNPMDEPKTSTNERVAQYDSTFLTVLRRSGRLDELAMGVAAIGVYETLSSTGELH